MVQSSINTAPNTSHKTLWSLILISLSTVMGFQVIRVFVTLLVNPFGEKFGQTLAVVPVVIVFLAPFLTPLLLKFLSPRKTFLIAIGGVAVVRLLMQFSHAVYLNLVLSGLATILILIGLVLALSRISTSTVPLQRQFAQGLLLGLTLESALNGAFLTWDYVWQSGIIPLITAVVVSLLALLALLRLDIQDQPPAVPSFRNLLPVAALGGFFMLEILFFQNMAFVPSSAQTSMELAFVTILIANAVGLVLSSLFSQQGVLVRLVGGGVLVVTTVLLPFVTGIMMLVLILIGQAALGGLLTCILNTLSNETLHSGIGRLAIITGIGSLLFASLTILYYIGALIALPFSYTLLLPVAAILILLTVFVAAPPVPDDKRSWRLAFTPLLLLLLPLMLFLTRPAVPAAPAAASSIRFLDYNIHQGISLEGWLDPEGTARLIEAQNPDVVTLQEITRGWVVAGSLDVAEWLSRRLQMPYVFAPGHDYQFGNIILTRMPITSWSFTQLPLHDVPMKRGLIKAEIDLGKGQSITVINTHLSAYASTEDRIPQVQKVLDVWNKSARTIIVGDMNAHPEDSDIKSFLQAGLTSAQDATGNSDRFTFSSGNPEERIDWIFGTAECQFKNFDIPSTTASDHLPLVVTIDLTE